MAFMYNHFSEQMNKVLGFFTIKSVKETALPKSGSSTFPWFRQTFSIWNTNRKKWYRICKYSSHQDERFPKEGFVNRWHMRKWFSSCN